MGQYVSQDPLGPAGGIRTHGYVHNPMTWVDPLGLAGCPIGHTYPKFDESAARFNRFKEKKAHRTEVATAAWSNHGGKHMRARTSLEAETMSSGKGAAQYLPSTNNRALERLAAQKGMVLQKPGGSTTKYFFYKSDQVIGYDGGVATRWIRAEITSGILHGHPINEARLFQQYGIR